MGIVLLLSLLLLIPSQTQAQEPIFGISQVKTQGATADDEFIELSNPAEFSADLSGYKLVKETTSGNQYTLLTFGQITIEPRSYLLISHRDGIFSVSADALYGTALADNNRLYLLAPDASVVNTVAWGTITGSTLANPGKEEVIARDWQQATQTWSSFQVEPFVQTHRSGDLVPANGQVPLENEPAEPETPSPTVRMNEVSLWPVPGDTAWVEIHNSSVEAVDLNGWTVQTTGQSLANLSGSIGPDSYVVVFWPSTNEIATSLLLYDTRGEVDSWEISSTQAPGTSLALDAQGQIQQTKYATAGRPNVIATIDDGAPKSCEPAIQPALQTPTNQESETIIAVSGRVRLNEVFANPAGDEASAEFIELYNEESFPIDLRGWSIADASKSTVLTNLRIETFGFLVLKRPESTLTLNNSDETVSLTDKTGAQISDLTYETTHEDLSLNWSTAGWYEAASTPGASNAVQVETPTESLPPPATNITAIPTTTTIATPTEISPAIDEHASMLRINEVLPNPAGSDDEEWIELYNTSGWNINLAGLTIADETKSYALPSQSVAPYGFFLIKRADSALALNNDTDHIELLNASAIIDEIRYESSVENQSWARNDQGTWQLTSMLTPGAANLFEIEEDTNASTPIEPTDTESTTAAKTSVAATIKKTATTASAKSPAKTKVPKQVDFLSWDDAKANEYIALRGVLIVAPGTFNEKTAYLQGEDGSGPGVELYFSKADWPTLDPGDIVLATGKKSAVKSGRRLLLFSTDDIEVLDHTDLTAAAVAIDGLTEQQHNTLVLLAGDIAKNGKNDLALQDANEAISVKLTKASIASPDLLPKSSGEVIGVYRYGAKPELWPRDETDVAIDEVDTNQTPLPVIDAVINSHDKTARTSTASPWRNAFLTISAAIVIGLAYFFKDRLLAYARQMITFIRQRFAI